MAYSSTLPALPSYDKRRQGQYSATASRVGGLSYSRPQTSTWAKTGQGWGSYDPRFGQGNSAMLETARAGSGMPTSAAQRQPAKAPIPALSNTALGQMTPESALVAQQQSDMDRRAEEQRLQSSATGRLEQGLQTTRGLWAEAPQDTQLWQAKADIEERRISAEQRDAEQRLMEQAIAGGWRNTSTFNEQMNQLRSGYQTQLADTRQKLYAEQADQMREDRYRRASALTGAELGTAGSVAQTTMAWRPEPEDWLGAYEWLQAQRELGQEGGGYGMKTYDEQGNLVDMTGAQQAQTLATMQDQGRSRSYVPDTLKPQGTQGPLESGMRVVSTSDTRTAARDSAAQWLRTQGYSTWASMSQWDKVDAYHKAPANVKKAIWSRMSNSERDLAQGRGQF